MPLNDNVMALRLKNSVEAVLGSEEAEKIAAAHPLSKSADFNKKFKWAGQICAYLDESFTPKQVKAVRMGCHCMPNQAEKTKLRKLYQSSSDIASFCESYTSMGGGSFTMWTENGSLFMCYPTCYCSCVKRAAGNLPQSWCICTLGYTKDLFDFVLERDTQVELLESIKTGGSRCIIKIT